MSIAWEIIGYNDEKKESARNVFLLSSTVHLVKELLKINIVLEVTWARSRNQRKTSSHVRRQCLWTSDKVLTASNFIEIVGRS